MDSERSKLRVRLRGGRAQRESQVDPSTEQSQHPRGLEGANQPRPKGQPPSSLLPHLRASLALTRQRTQQSPWEHWAPTRSEQLWAKQQGSRHSWNRKGEEGPGE